MPLTDSIAAVSVGMVDGAPLLDLAYVEDSRAESDMNVVMTGAGRLVEVQATAEGQTFSRGELDVLLDLAEAGVRELTAAQLAAVAREDRPRHRQPRQGGRAGAAAPRRRGQRRARGLRRGGDRGHAAPERLDQGRRAARPGRRRRARARRRLGPRRPRARRPARASSAPATPVPTRPTPTTAGACSTRWRAWTTARAAFVCVLVGLGAGRADAGLLRHAAPA